MKGRFLKTSKILVLLLVFVLLSQYCVIDVEAQYTSDISYFNNYKLGDDQIDNLIAVALGQKNKKEKELGYYPTQKYNSEKEKVKDFHWCAAFISDCARIAGIPTTVLKNTTFASPGPQNFNIEFHSNIKVEDKVAYTPGSYKPKKGDLIFFDTDKGGQNWNHVGIVTRFDDEMQTVFTIEGNIHGAEEKILIYKKIDGKDVLDYELDNYNGSVKEKSYKISTYMQIRGYGVPAYATSAKVPSSSNDAFKTMESNNSRYAIFDYKTSWENAKIICEGMGGHLVTINSASEQNDVMQLVANLNKPCWIGANRSASSNSFSWITGEVFSYTNWDSGEPSYTSGENKELYVGIYANDTDTSYSTKGKWNDFSSTSTTVKGFVCEWDLSNNGSYSNWTNIGWTKTKPVESATLRITDIKTVTEQVGYIQYDLFCYDVVGRSDGITRTYRLDVAKGGTSYTYREATAKASECVHKSSYNWNGTLWHRVSYNGNNYWFRNTTIEHEVPAVTHTEWYYQTREISTPAPNIENILINTNPAKIAYYKGETLNTAGLTLTAKYSNGTSETVTSGFTCSPTSLSQTGTQQITVTYGGKSTTFNVTVNDIQISSITVKTNPNKTSYYKGDTLDTAGLTLAVKYSNGTTGIISSGFTCNPTTFSTTGVQQITVTYGDKFDTFNATVTELKVKSIAIQNPPNKVTYNVGDTFETNGLSLLVTYSDNTTKVITSEFICYPMAFSGAGTQEINVLYGGMLASFNVSVGNSGPGGDIPNFATLYYNANGGIEPPSPQTGQASRIVDISTEIPSRTGYTFLGWANSATESVSWKPGVSIFIQADKTLYAIWESEHSTVITLTIGSTRAQVNSNTAFNDVAPIIKNDRTMLPARFVAENLGAKVEWIDAERAVKITGIKGELIMIYIGSSTAYVNGSPYILDSPAFIENDRTYVPVRFIGESLGATVEWINSTRQVIITK